MFGLLVPEMVKMNPTWLDIGFKRGQMLMTKQGQYKTQVRVCFDVDMCWILYPF